jgi:hypothetical protein
MKRALTSVAIGCLLLAGCSDLSSTVVGVVKLDGQPLSVGENQRGTVVFRPVDGGPTSTGRIDKFGKFKLSTGANMGVIPGDYMVAVRLVDIIPEEGEMPAPSGRPATPAIYADPLNSGLQFSITRGVNNISIELDSSAGPIQTPLPSADDDVEAGVSESVDDERSDDESLDEPQVDSEASSVDETTNAPANSQGDQQ